jgi:SWI/SNF related-matrix-associated actin-dependent regulator of chromatin subfamily C
MHEDDWDKVSDHVGTRTKEQCIVHFLQLPIEDPYLESTQKELGPLQYNRMPFSKEDNPIMSVMAFLAETVDKEVAAKAAGESIEELEKGLRKKAESAREAKGKAVEGEDKEKEKDDAMEVDGGAKDEDSGDKIKDVEDEVESSKTSPRKNIEKAALVALGSAAAKAHVLALEEDASLHSLVTSVVEAQVRKLSLKMAHFDQLESLLEVERRSVEQSKQQLYEDRLKLARMMQEVQGLYARAKQSQAAAAAITPQEMGSMMAGSGLVAGRQPMMVQQPSIAPQVTGEFVQMG